MNSNNLITFIELLEQEKKVEIPIIQRDYAQGRIDSSEIMINFLNVIKDALLSKNEIELDFIYGSVENESFQPLDGQQRLTTLFLLHWYALLKDNRLENYKNLLQRFTYETRITSREFCTALVQANDIDLNNEKISYQIVNSKWFFITWQHDQTIDSMLRALDLIHTEFSNLENLSTLLLDQKLIKFYNINLNNIGLTDDLYIKMNARGKLLSPFENFKASFEKYLKYNLFQSDNNRVNNFAFNIDTKWTDFLWTHFRYNNKIDQAFMSFFSTIIMFHLGGEKHQDRFLIIQSLQDNPNKIRPEYISNICFDYIEKALNFYTNTVIDYQINIPLYRHAPNKDLFSQILDSQVTSSYTQKVLFYAQSEYLLKNNIFLEDKFNDWMRVIRNIIARGNVAKGGKRTDIIRSPEAFVGVITLISELSSGSEDIYKFLREDIKIHSTFAREQLEEERKKAKLMIDEQIKSAIFDMEDLILFKGRISFIFDCIDYKTESSKFDLDKFVKVKDIIKTYFNNESIDLSNDVRRALLTIEISRACFYDYWSSYWYVGEANKRCLIENFNELEYIINNTTQKIFIKDLIQKLLIKDLIQIINDYTPSSTTPNWRTRLIKESELLDKYCDSNYIAIDNKNKKCYLLISKRPREIDNCFVVE